MKYRDFGPNKRIFKNMTTSNTHNWIIINYGGRTEEGWRTSNTKPEGVPLPSYLYGRERVAHKSSEKDYLWC